MRREHRSQDSLTIVGRRGAAHDSKERLGLLHHGEITLSMSFSPELPLHTQESSLAQLVPQPVSKDWHACFLMLVEPDYLEHSFVMMSQVVEDATEAVSHLKSAPGQNMSLCGFAVPPSSSSRSKESTIGIWKDCSLSQTPPAAVPRCFWQLCRLLYEGFVAFTFLSRMSSSLSHAESMQIRSLLQLCLLSVSSYGNLQEEEKQASTAPRLL